MTLLAPFLAAAAAAALLTPTVRTLAKRAGYIAPPADNRWHSEPTALMGGVAVFGAFLAGLAVAFWLGDVGAPLSPEDVGRPGIGIVLAASIMFAAGLADDRFGLRPATKLILQALAGAVLVSFGVVYPVTPWMPVNVLATLFWFLALTNALNLLDNMDGVAVGVAAIAALFLAVTFGWEGEWLLAATCAALVGAAAGFLPYNFQPASIFMGDSGSMFLGALLAGLGAAFPSTASGSIVAVLFVPAIIVLIPILDTSFVTLTRTLSGRLVSNGGSDHAAHQLVAMGLSERQAALFMYSFAAIGGVVALVVYRADIGFGLWITAALLVTLSIAAAYLGRLHSYEPDQVDRNRPVTVMVSNLMYKRRAFEVFLDLILFALAYYGAYLLRYDGQPPATQAQIAEQTLALAVVAKALAFGLCGVYRGVWKQTTIVDLHRISKATLLGSVLTVTAVVFFFREASFARSIFLIDALLVGVLTTAARASVRSLDLVQHSLNGAGPRTLIYGAGRGGALVLRETRSNPELKLHPIGFVDDDEQVHGRLVHGLPVVCAGEGVRGVVQRRDIEKVVIAAKMLDGGRRERLCRTCDELGIELLQMKLELETIQSDEPGVISLADAG